MPSACRTTQTVRCNIFVHIGITNLLQNVGIICGIVALAEQFRRAAHDVGGVGEETLRDEVFACDGGFSVGIVSLVPE